MQPADSDPSLGSVFAIRTPTLQFALLGLLGFLFFFIATSLGLEQTPRDGSVGVPAASYILAVIILGWMVQRNYPHSTIGICNAVTLIRLTIVAILFTAVIAEPPPSMSMVALAVFALCLDGIDGWFARKQGLASEFGARFDVEVDAAFALLL
ncbi:MAG: CDP-alcohol phosphatidyltransferase family protein, partial [Pseudomonadota bacterium]